MSLSDWSIILLGLPCSLLLLTAGVGLFWVIFAASTPPTSDEAEEE